MGGGSAVWGKLQRWWHDRNLQSRIREHGWTAVYVGDYRTPPTWVYSVGFDGALDQPEIVIFDVPQESANAMMWEAFRSLGDGSLVLEDGKDWADEPDGRCVWRKVHPSQIDSPDGWLTFAGIQRARRTGRTFGLEAFQLVLCDAERRMPWEEDYDEHLRRRQPALWLPADPRDADVANPIEREARRLVRERGWTAVPIDGPDLHWAYTVGLPEDIGAPELILFGLNGEGCAHMLIDVQRHLRDGRLALEDGLRWDALGYELCWRRVHPEQYLGINWLHLAKEVRQQRTGGREAVEVFQAFAPDSAGRYPWEELCAPTMRAAQPQLFLAPEAEPHARRMLAAAGAL